MDLVNNLNKNIFGDSHKQSSDSIDFSANPLKAQVKQKIFGVNITTKTQEQKPTNKLPHNVSLGAVTNEKHKEKKVIKDPLSYSGYKKSELKNIKDPLSQMRPDSNFGYPTKKKETKTEPKKENTEHKEIKENKEKNETNKNNETNNNNTTTPQKSKEAVMTGLFGDYSNINKNIINPNLLQMNPNILNNNNNNINTAANIQLIMNQITNYQNALNQQNMIFNVNLFQNNQINNLNNNNMQTLNKPPITLNKNTPKKNIGVNVLKNELGQTYKIGDLYSDTNLIRKKLEIMDSESIKDISKATLNEPDTKYMGVLVLTDFRLIFKMENEKYLNLNNNYSEDYFKIHLFSISKIEKVQDKKMSYNAIPMEITLKDTRVIKFHLYDLSRFYFNLVDLTNPVDYKQFYSFPKTYNESKFLGKNITDGWKIYDPIIEFSRQGITEDNDLGLRYCYINKNFQICPTYPEFLIEPKDITDDELRQSSTYRTKGRIPIFSYYYSGNDNSGKKVTPSIWRSAQNKRGLMGNKNCPADIKLLNSISKLGGDNGKLYIYDCRPKLNAFVNRVGGGGYEKAEDYANATLYFCEIDNIHKARKALNALYSLCLSNKINDYNNFWTNLEQSGWFQFIYLMLKNANEISKTLQSNHSVLIHCSDGWDRTAQLSSLSQLLLDPFYRTINGFAILIEKDWLSFGHQFGLRNGFSDKDKQDQASPIFLQFLDAVHQLLEQFPNAFEFNEKFLIFLAKNYRINLYGTFLYNNEKERKEENAKNKTASVWTEIFCDLKPYLNIYYDPNSVKILEPNYSYYNLKLWTTLFMENNIYLENKHFFASENDKSIAFKSKQEFFAFKKKEDENRYIINQNKYEELLKMTAEIYLCIKDDKEILDNLSKESKKQIEELKPELDKINKNRIMKKELIDKLKSKKEVKPIEKNEAKDLKENSPQEDKKDDKKEETKEEKKEETKEEIKEKDKEKTKEEENNNENKENDSSKQINENNDKNEEKKEEIKTEENKKEEAINNNDLKTNDTTQEQKETEKEEEKKEKEEEKKE